MKKNKLPINQKNRFRNSFHQLIPLFKMEADVPIDRQKKDIDDYILSFIEPISKYFTVLSNTVQIGYIDDDILYNWITVSIDLKLKYNGLQRWETIRNITPKFKSGTLYYNNSYWWEYVDGRWLKHTRIKTTSQ